MEHKADIYHFHDPELIPVAILLRILGKKVIYDVHEDVPKDILDKEWIQSTILKKTFSALAEIAEFVADNAMSGVVVVTEPIGNRFNNSNKILLRNLPVLSIMDKIRAENRTAHEKLIIYIGGLTRIRGIREIIQAMEHINARMWIIGEWDDPTYEELCKKEKGAEKVEFYGFLKPVQAFAKLKAADAAIVNFLPAHNHTFALPNKPFEYMACGIPFVMSDFEYWQSIFSDYALFADPTDPLKIASQLNRILNDPELHKKLSESGRKAVETELCWEKEVVKLDDLYRQLGG